MFGASSLDLFNGSFAPTMEFRRDTAKLRRAFLAIHNQLMSILVDVDVFHINHDLIVITEDGG
jgi:hypothetical protein